MSSNIKYLSKKISLKSVFESDQILSFNQNFGVIHYKNYEIFPLAADIINEHKGFIAGGFARFVRNIDDDKIVKKEIIRESINPDIDVYFETEQQAKTAALSLYKQLIELVKSTDKLFVKTKQSISNNAEEIYICFHQQDRGPFRRNGMKFQFMTKFTGTVEEIFSQYDFENVQVALTENELIYNENVVDLEVKKLLSIFSDKSPCLLGRLKKYIVRKKLIPTEESLKLVESRLNDHIENQLKTTFKWVTDNPEIYVGAPRDAVALVFLLKTLDPLFAHLSDKALFDTIPFYIMGNNAYKFTHQHCKLPDHIKHQIKPVEKIRNRTRLRKYLDDGIFEAEAEASMYPEFEKSRIKAYVENFPPVSRE